jgi:asparagine synthase (glutamine-hydrolysing)
MLTSGVWNDYGDEEFKVKRRVPVETRHPFFDLRLVQFCLRLPIGQRLRDGLTRSIMRRGLRRYLPDAIAERAGKGDLSGGFEEGLRRQLSTFLTPSVRDRLSAYVPVRFLDEGRDHVLTARRIHPILSQRLFAALVLGMWLEEASL